MAGNSSAGFAERLVSMAWFEITKLDCCRPNPLMHVRMSKVYSFDQPMREKSGIPCPALPGVLVESMPLSYALSETHGNFHLNIIVIHLPIWFFFVMYIMDLCYGRLF